METRDEPELVMKRKVCGLCGEGVLEFDLDTYIAQEYVCPGCLGQ